MKWIIFSLILIPIIMIFLCRKKFPKEKKMIWLALRFAVALTIAISTFSSTIYDYLRGENIHVYLTFLIVGYSVMDAVDYYKEYKIEEKRVRGND